jgi:hypothetical protein
MEKINQNNKSFNKKENKEPKCTVVDVPAPMDTNTVVNSKVVLWALVLVIVIATYNGLVGIAGLIKMIIIYCNTNPSNGITHDLIGISILTFLSNILVSGIFVVIAMGPVDKIRKMGIYTATGTIFISSFIIWIMSLFTPYDRFDIQFVCV